MIFYDVLGDGEAEAVAVIHRTGFVDAIEALEDFFEILWADRVPRIRDAQQAVVRAAFLECHLDRALWSRVFLCVIEEDLDDLLQVLWRAVDRDAVGDVLGERQAPMSST